MVTAHSFIFSQNMKDFHIYIYHSFIVSDDLVLYSHSHL